MLTHLWIDGFRNLLLSSHCLRSQFDFLSFYVLQFFSQSINKHQRTDIGKDSEKPAKMGEQQFFLKWNDFQNNMVSSFKHLRDEKSFTDVSLTLGVREFACNTNKS